MLNHFISKLTALDLFGAFHLSGEIVGDGFGADGFVEAFDDEVGGFLPAHVFEHHVA